jgi:hypothetical protein
MFLSSGDHDIKANLYLEKHFEGNTTLYTILQKK